MESKLRTREETIGDYYLVYSFCMKKRNLSTSLPRISRGSAWIELARIELEELEEKDYLSYLEVRSDIREFLKLTDKLHRDLEQSLRTRPGNASEIEESRIDFDLTRSMYQRTSKAFGLEIAEEFLKFYFANSDKLEQGQRGDRQRHIDYICRNLPFVDYLIDKKTGKNPFTKIRNTPEPSYSEAQTYF